MGAAREDGGSKAGSHAKMAHGPRALAGAEAACSRVPAWRAYAELARQAPERIYRDCEVDVFRATGPGGQGVNTTDSAVRMRHVPTGITVVSRESRSQTQNRATCLRKLHDIFDRLARPPKPRKKTKPTKASKERRLKAKRMNAERKALRSRHSID